MTNTHRFIVAPFNWTTLIAEVNSQGRNEFEKIILNCKDLEKDQLLEHGEEYHARDQHAFELAKRHRSGPEALIHSAVRNWSRQQAVRLLNAEKEGKSIRKDYQDAFECRLREEITARITELEQAWQAEEEQKMQQAALNRRFEQDRALKDDHKPLIDAYSALDRAYAGREQAVQAGYSLAKQFAQGLEDRMVQHEQHLENMAGEVLGLMQGVRTQQQAGKGRIPMGCLLLAVVAGLPLLAVLILQVIL